MNTNETELVNFVGKVPVNILTFRRHTHDFNGEYTLGWEKEYLLELHKHLAPGKIVFDIGAEQGEFSAFAAAVCGGENLHLFEPSNDYWPNIKRVWEANSFKDPFCFNGFVSKKMILMDFSSISGKWPLCSGGSIFTGTNQICTHDNRFKDKETISLDFYCELRGAIPDIIMIDCEGAEVDIIDGAKNILKENNPVIFISVHSDDAIGMHGRKRQELFSMMSDFGYTAEHIHTDHEEHWKFYKSNI